MKTRSLVNAAMMMAIYFVFFILYYIGIMPGIVAFTLPLPFIVFHMTHKKQLDLIWMFVGCLIGTYLIGSVFGVLTTLLYGLVGVILAIGMEKEWPYWNRILNASLVYVVMLPLITKVLTDMSMADTFVEVLQTSIAMANEMVAAVGQENTNKTLEMYNRISEMIPTLIPALMPTILIFFGGFSAWITEKLSAIILKRMNLADVKSQPLTEFQLGTMPVIVLFICNIASIFITHGSFQVIFVNIMILLNVLFMIQGFILIFIFFKARSQKGLGIGVIIFALLSNLSLFVSMLGMMDAVFNYRNRLKKS